MIRYFFNTLVLFAVWASIPSTGYAQCLHWLTPNSAPAVTSDVSSNNPEYWNDLAFSDPLLGGANDLAEGAHPVFLFKADCGPNPTFSFVLKLDLNRDGIKETVVTPDNQLPDGALWINNANEPGYIGTEQAYFDLRPVSAQDKYRFVVHTEPQNDSTLVRLAWVSTAQPNVWADAQLPYGAHELELTATNGTETQTQVYSIQINDTQSPDVVCINGLAINLMPTGTVQVWASDILQFTQDNFSNGADIELGMRRVGAGTGFPLDLNGAVVNFEIFDCADNGEAVAVELWARDQYGNTQSCQTNVQVWDANFICNPTLAMQYQSAPNCEDDNYLWAVVTGGKPPLQYQWSNGSVQPYLVNMPNGTYSVTVTTDNGKVVSGSFTVNDAPTGCSVLNGYLYKDADSNCTLNNGELTLQSETILLEDGNGNQFFTISDANGYFQKRLSPGNYSVSAFLDNNLWAACPPTGNIVLAAGDTVLTNVGLQATYDCAAMTVEVQTPYLFSCSNNEHWVTYCNEGTDNATGAYVDIELDEYSSMVSASVPYTLLSGNTYRFEVGDVSINSCGNFSFLTFLSCQSVNGQTHCIAASAAPIGDCLPQNALWNGASIDLVGHCDGDSLRFEIKNVGQGDMTQSVEYIVIEDLVMVHEGNVGPLLAGESMTVALPYNGSTWRMEVDQVAFHPGASKPALSVESCNGNVFTLGTVNQFYLDEGSPWEDTECLENSNYYLGNLKYAFPQGYGPTHAIEPGTQLNYTVNFLNTTSDTIHTVIVRDTLSAWLDPATIALTGSNYPYAFEFEGNGPNLKFTFNNLNLPPIDQNNPFNSFHWVNFSILPKADVPLGTDIYNTGYIYFDNDPAIATNTVQHRVQEGFVASAISPTQQPGEHLAQWLELSPNPAHDWLLLKHSAVAAGKACRYLVTDMSGKVLLTVPATTGVVQRLPLSGIVAGTYTVQLWDGHQRVATEWFVKK